MRKRNKVIIFLGFIILVISLALPSNVSAEIIVVSGHDNNNLTPPSESYEEPTVSFVQCPEGYDCIREGDYNAFIWSLTVLAERMEIKADFIESILERFDKKMALDEETITKLLNLAQTAEDTSQRIMHELDKYKGETAAELVRIRQENKTLTVQVNEIKASDFWRFLFTVLIVFLVITFMMRFKPHSRFWWNKFVEWFPIKL